MTADGPKTTAPEWASASGDAWARRWRDTDAGLAGLSPYLMPAILTSAPPGPFKAFEIGCGAGSTAIAVADALLEARIVACDISPALVRLAEHRTAGVENIEVLLGDAEALAASEGPFDLIYSRHGVMFFCDPVRAFRRLRDAAIAGASLIFSCFQNWDLNPWASELAAAAAGRVLPPPGREPGGFAFAAPSYVFQILGSSGWVRAEPSAVEFLYVAGQGKDAVDHALSYLTEIGPASRVVEMLPEQERGAAITRMRGAIERRFDGKAVTFPAAAWIWHAEAGAAA